MFKKEIAINLKQIHEIAICPLVVLPNMSIQYVLRQVKPNLKSKILNIAASPQSPPPPPASPCVWFDIYAESIVKLIGAVCLAGSYWPSAVM